MSLYNKQPGAGLAVPVMLAVLVLCLAWPIVRAVAYGVRATVETVNCILSAGDIPKCELTK